MHDQTRATPKGSDPERRNVSRRHKEGRKRSGGKRYLSWGGVATTDEVMISS
jgi:hypothetical protein